MGAIVLGLFRIDLPDNFCEGDLFAAILCNAVVVDDEEGVGAMYELVGTVWLSEDALAWETNSIRIGGFPDVLLLGMFAELEILKALPHFVVKDLEVPMTEEGCG